MEPETAPQEDREAPRKFAPSTLTRSVALFGIARTVPGIANFLTLPLLTRYLTSAEYGEYALLLSVIGLGNAVAFQWLRHSAIRFFPVGRNEDEVEAFFATANLCLAVSALASASVAIIVAVLFQVNSTPVALIAAILAMIAQANFDITREAARANLDVYSYGMAALVRAFVSLLSVFVLVRVGLGIPSAFIGLALGSACGTAAFGRSWRYSSLKSYSPTLTRSLLRYGLPIAGTIGIVFLIDANDRYFLAQFASTAELGIYAAAFSLAQQPVGVLMSSVHLAGLPYVLRHHPDEQERALGEYAALLLAMVSPLIVLLLAWPSAILTVALGPDYSGAPLVVRLIALAVLISGLRSSLLNVPLQLKLATSRLIYPAIIALAVSLGGNAIAVPRAGIYGAAAVALLTSIVYLLATVPASLRAVKLKVARADLFGVGSGLLVMLVIVAVLPCPSSLVELILCASILMLVYTATILAFDVASFRTSILRKKHNGRKFGETQ